MAKSSPEVDQQDIERLYKLIESELINSGWSKNGDSLSPPILTNKDSLRRFHRTHRIERAQKERIEKRIHDQADDEYEQGDTEQKSKRRFSPQQQPKL